MEYTQRGGARSYPRAMLRMACLGCGGVLGPYLSTPETCDRSRCALPVGGWFYFNRPLDTNNDSIKIKSSRVESSRVDSDTHAQLLVLLRSSRGGFPARIHSANPL
eukprot:2235771-Prymnesium_polylepis.1